VPCFPDCPTGWDDSARLGAGAHMVTHRTPDHYERLLRAAQHFLVEHPVDPTVVFLSAWNEWTEDSLLLPESVFGYPYLDAVHRAFRREGCRPAVPPPSPGSSLGRSGRTGRARRQLGTDLVSDRHHPRRAGHQ
jgi:hypothetical protein